MTILGRADLIRRLSTSEMVVSPILTAQQIGASSIDLRMGNIVLMVRARGASHVDPALAKLQDAHVVEADRHQKHERYEIPFQTKFLLHPGSLALVPTLEWVQLPKDVFGTVTARSTWAREGLSIATATLIEPRYQGIVTLELCNLGQIPLALYPGLPIAQIAFSTVDGDTARPSDSQFKLSFEPQQGIIATKAEFPFLPDQPRVGEIRQ
jgi:dCTP deaminase